MGLFSKWSRGLRKTRKGMTNAIDEILGARKVIDEELYEDLEEALIMGDVGVVTSARIITEVRNQIKRSRDKEPEKVRAKMEEVIAGMLRGGEELHLETKPSVILVIGVNGVGKTTTIGKLAARFKAEGKKVILGAADTFRAAAIEQLQEWADRAGVEMIKHREGADPAAVVFDAIAAGKARGADVIICDTAGRLHNKKNLMDELNKIYRVIGRELPDADRECLLVLDATTGQNAVNQAREFKAAADITGIVLTKLDGTARGGVVLAIKNELEIPVKFVGVGEQIDDLQPFDPEAFAKGLFMTQEDEEDGILGQSEAGEDGPADYAGDERGDVPLYGDRGYPADSEEVSGSAVGTGEDAPPAEQAAGADDDRGAALYPAGEEDEGGPLPEGEDEPEDADDRDTVTDGTEPEEETDETPADAGEEEPKKKRRGFFGFFNRNA